LDHAWFPEREKGIRAQPRPRVFTYDSVATSIKLATPAPTESGSPIAEGELRAFCQSGLAKYKVPKAFVHLAELPKGDSGKILKRALLEIPLV
jgi:acyl-coenzyme A synthetase/AMP-(fatty) acid ligase